MPLRDELETAAPAPKQPRRSLRMAVLSVLAVLACAAILVSFVQPAKPQRIAIPDHTVLRLDAVTFGTEERISGTLWQRFLRALAPNPLKDATGARAYQGGTPGALTFWTIREHGPMAGMMAELRAAPVDERGCSGPPAESQSLSFDVERYVCESYPRRGNVVRLRIYQRVGGTGRPTDWAPVGDFVAGNPNPGPHPDFSPPQLPVVAKSGPVELRFTDLSAGCAPPEGLWLSHFPGEVYWRLSSALQVNGQPTTGWTASLRSVEDASGNRWKIVAYGSALGDFPRSEELYFTGPYCSDERAVKAHLELRRTRAGTYAPDELWTVRGIPVPGKGHRVDLNRTATVQGVPLELEAVLGPWARLPRSLAIVSLVGLPRLVLKLPSEMPDGLEGQFLRATDDRGRLVTVFSSNSTGEAGGTLQAITILPQPGARSFDLVYAVQRVRELDVTLPVRYLHPPADAGKPAGSGAH